jgi:hypothetical protein
LADLPWRQGWPARVVNRYPLNLLAVQANEKHLARAQVQQANVPILYPRSHARARLRCSSVNHHKQPALYKVVPPRPRNTVYFFVSKDFD